MNKAEGLNVAAIFILLGMLFFAGGVTLLIGVFVVYPDHLPVATVFVVPLLCIGLGAFLCSLAFYGLGRMILNAHLRAKKGGLGGVCGQGRPRGKRKRDHNVAPLKMEKFISPFLLFGQ